MATKMPSARPALTTVLTAVLLVATGFAVGDAAPLRRVTTATTGLVGLAPGQVARLNVIDVGGTRGARSNVQLLILDAAGAVLGEQRAQLGPGDSTALEVDHASLGTGLGRVQIQAKVKIFRSLRAGSARRDLIATLELYDTDGGRTISLVSCPLDVLPSGGTGGRIGPFAANCLPCQIKFTLEL
jgi:hypothetical protein